MQDTALKRKLNTLEAEVKALRIATRRPVDLSVDEANWNRLKTTSKRVRRKLFKQRYG
jgi:hypothetical protein